MISSLVFSLWLLGPLAQTATPSDAAPSQSAATPAAPQADAEKKDIAGEKASSPGADAGQSASDADRVSSRQAQAPAMPGASAQISRAERELIKRELMEELNASLDEQRQKLRAEIRAQIEAESASRLLEDSYVYREDKPRLELLEIDGYFRVRPELFYNLDLGRGADPSGNYLFPRPARDGKTLADVNMRWRIQPTLNISEDVRLHAQLDVFDNLIFGATPDGVFGPNDNELFAVAARNQAYPSEGGNWLSDSIIARRVYGEVVTPIGQFLFGRMGSHWGMGMLTNSGGESITSNYGGGDLGDSVDRLMFVSMPLAGHYIVPFIDFVSEGPTSTRRGELFGQAVDLEQSDDARDYGLSVARRDTELEIQRKLGAGQSIINYGLYFVYRTQSYDAADFHTGSDISGDTAELGYVARKASFYIPDLWFKFQSKRWKAEIELAGIFGKIEDVRTSALDDGEGQDISVMQFGGVARGEFLPIPSLSISLEAGFASGDKGAGMGNSPGRSGDVEAGIIDGPQFCLSDQCAVFDDRVTNFRFNRAYQVDLILWRELLQGVTDAIYIKPGIRYEIISGLDVWANFIYSRALFGSSTPSSIIDSSGELSGHADLGIEIDLGAQYVSGDGFVAGVGYGVLFPLSGLNNRLEDLDAGTAHMVRGWFGIIY
ncbi:MAG: TIGR04551 family protein [Myxococcaceae bacterium]|nr:TIGR04551 family protein [Myxococcaceae bacterium]